MKNLLISIICLFSMAAHAKTDITPSIYQVYDLNNNTILTSKNENQVHSIASLTKLMTAHVFLKYYPENLNKCVSQVSNADNDTIKNTRTRILKNKPISCENLLQLMLLASDNYAASAIAGSIPNKSRKDFFDLMNKEAKNIGMKNTFYKDSSGLSFENKSTASDLLKLVKVIMKNAKLKQLSSLYGVQLNTGEKNIIFKNSNKLIRENLFSAELSKTGYISESGYNLIFVNKKTCNKKKIAIIVMGAKNSQFRAKFAQDMLEKYSCHKN